MTEKNTDLRVRKTKQALISTMLSMLEKQSFDKITVRDICTQALISRTAFYKHFEDKYALLEECIKIINERIFENTKKDDIYEHIKAIVENSKDNSKSIMNLLQSGHDEMLVETIRKSLQQSFENYNEYGKKLNENYTLSKELIPVYYSTAWTNTILFWIRKKMPHTPVELTDFLYSQLSKDFK